MSDYLQPDFYRFNQDSLELVSWIKGQVEEASSILDLGAGCGVIGIELATHYQPKNLSLVEAQKDFANYLEHNHQQFAPDVKTEISICSFSEFFPQDQFDLIAINPPYFLAGRGEVSSDPRKHQCRTFVRDNWQELFLCIKRALKPKGHCYIVIRKDPQVQAEVSKFASMGFTMIQEEREKLLFIGLSLTE